MRILGIIGLMLNSVVIGMYLMSELVGDSVEFYRWIISSFFVVICSVMLYFDR